MQHGCQSPAVEKRIQTLWFLDSIENLVMFRKPAGFFLGKDLLTVNNDFENSTF